MKLRFLWVGKTKNDSVRQIVDDFLERIQRFSPIETIEIRDRNEPAGVDKEGNDLLQKISSGSTVVVLEAGGSQMSSEQFARFLDQHRHRATKELNFVVGGPNGLSAAVRQRADLLLSLSSMTFTHEMARAILAEQVYRAFAIIFRLPYHK